MSYSYDRYETQRRRQPYGASSRRSTLGYWVPLALTVTAATISLAAWIWSERSDDDDDDEYDDRGGPPPAPNYGDSQPGQAGYAHGEETLHVEDDSMMARMSGALRRTPSPQQLFDGAREHVVAGVTAAGAVVGGALSSIREEDKRDFEDHSRWSEEAASRAEAEAKGVRGPQTMGGQASTGAVSRQARPAGGRRKAVAIVVSAQVEHQSQAEEDVAYLQEHAVSRRSQFPRRVDANIRIAVDPLPSPATHKRRHPRLRAHLRPRPEATPPRQTILLLPTRRLHRLLLLEHRPGRPPHPRRRRRQAPLDPRLGPLLLTHAVAHVHRALHASPSFSGKPYHDNPLHDAQRARAPTAASGAGDRVRARIAVGQRR